MIELEDLRAFLAVAEERNFGRAAVRLLVTQPALSRRIRRLEDAIPARLFRRTTRTVELTDAGTAFLPEAQSVLAAADRAVETARRTARGESGRLLLGAVTPSIDGFLPGVLHAFRREHPQITVSIEELDTQSQLAAVRDGRLHAGFVRLFDHDVRGLGARVVHREPHVVALPPGHPLAARRRVPLRMLAGEPLVALAGDVQPELHRRIAAACARAGFEPRVVQTTRTVHTVCALVAAGIGAALVPASAAARLGRSVAVRPVVGGLPAVEIAAVWRAFDPSPVLAKFQRTLAAHGKTR